MDILLQLRSVVACAAILVVAHAVGRIAARCLRFTAEDHAAAVVWNTALGFVLCGSLFTALGLTGSLYGHLIFALTTVGVVAEGVYQVRRRSKRASCAWTNYAAMPLEPQRYLELPNWLYRLLLVGVSTAAAAALLSALAPTIAGDALCYHLELPKRYLQAHALTHLPYSDNSTYPLLAEMWFLWGLALDGPIAAQLIHWSCGLLLAGGAYVVGLPIVGRRAAVVAACLTLLTPGVNNQMTAPLNDVALAAFTTLAFAATCRAVRQGETTAFVVAGLMLGGALAVKFTALVFVVAGLAAIAVAALGNHREISFIARGIGVATVMASILAGPWYARAWYYHGDPLYPFLSSQSHSRSTLEPSGSSLSQTPLKQASAFPTSKTPLGRGPTAWLEAPWLMTMQPERFGGRGHQLGPFWLMSLPLVGLVPAALRFRLAPLFLVALPYAGACLLLRQNVRFLLPLVPFGAVVVVCVWSTFLGWPRAPRVVGWFAVAGVLLLLTLIPVGRARHHVGVAVGLESRAEYLSRCEPTFAAACWANAHLPPGAHLLSQEHRAYWFQSTLTRDNIFRRSHDYSAALTAEAATLSPTLRSHGFTHLLLAEAEGSDTPAYEATLSQAFEQELRKVGPGSAPKVVAEFHAAAPEAGSRRYRIVELR